MRVIKPNKKGVQQAVSILKKGGVIIYPTDTAYGLGGIYNSKKVVEKILQIKNRKDKKFTIIAASFNQVQKYFKLNLVEKKLAKKYWPGPLSIVVSDRFAVRVPKNSIARSLARQVGKPLIATSANFSGSDIIFNSWKLIQQFKNKKSQPDLILDKGTLKKNKTSTIIKVEAEKIKVLRPGSISLKEATRETTTKIL